MKTSKWVRAVLVIAGIMAVFVGSQLLFNPIEFEKASGIDLAGKVSLLSEVRAPGGVLFLCGLLFFVGAFSNVFTFPALVVATIVYLGYGLSRVYAISVDGMPSSVLLGALAVEIITGIICIFLLQSTYRYIKIKT